MNAETLKRMTPNELERYAKLLDEVEEANNNVIYAQNDMIDILQRLYNCQMYRDDNRAKLNSKMNALRSFEHQMEQEPVVAGEEDIEQDRVDN